MQLNPLETERLIVRPLISTDASAILAYTSDPDVMTFIPGGVSNAAEAQAFVDENVSDAATAFAIVLKSSKLLIGHLVFHPWYAPLTYEIGWILHPAYHARGYTTEAARAMLAYGFEKLHLHRVIATCQPENPASYRVMEKLGMRREAHFYKAYFRGDNVWWDEYLYAMLDQEWSSSKEQA